MELYRLTWIDAVPASTPYLQTSFTRTAAESGIACRQRHKAPRQRLDIAPRQINVAGRHMASRGVANWHPSRWRDDGRPDEHQGRKYIRIAHNIGWAGLNYLRPSTTSISVIAGLERAP
jgi:hypothetical protein